MSRPAVSGSARRTASTSARTSACADGSAAATKLTEATRSRTPARVRPGRGGTRGSPIARTARIAERGPPPASQTCGSSPASVRISSPMRVTHGTDSSRRFQASRSRAAGSEHAVDLGERADRVEPVERLRDDDRVDRARGQRDRLGGAVDDLDRPGVADGARELRAHPGTGSRATIRAPDGTSESGQLPGPGAELEERASGPQVEPLDDGGDGVRRIVGAGALVQVGGRRQSAGGRRVDRVGHGPDPRAGRRTRRSWTALIGACAELPDAGQVHEHEVVRRVDPEARPGGAAVAEGGRGTPGWPAPGLPQPSGVVLGAQHVVRGAEAVDGDLARHQRPRTPATGPARRRARRRGRIARPKRRTSAAVLHKPAARQPQPACSRRAAHRPARRRATGRST